MVRTWISGNEINSRLDAGFYRTEFVDAARAVSQVARTCTLESVRKSTAPIRRGIDMPRFVPNGTGAKLIRLQAFRAPTIDASILEEVEQTQHKAFHRSIVNSGDLLVAMGGYVGKAAIVPPQLAGANINRHTARVVIDDTRADKYFIWAFIESPTGTTLFERFVTGGVQAGINLEDLREIPIPCPEPDIQRAIGNKVRKAERLRELAVLNQQLLDQALKDRFGCPPETRKNATSWWMGSQRLSPHRLNPTTYHPYCLVAEDIVESKLAGVELETIIPPKDLSSGATPLGANYPKEGIHFIHVKNVYPNYIDLGDVERIDSATDAALSRSRLRSNDVVLTIRGSIGRAAVVSDSHLAGNINQDSVRFSVTNNWNPYYIAAFLNCEWGAAQVRRRANVGTRIGLDFPSVLSLKIPQIEQSEQETIGTHAQLYGDYLTQSAAFVEEAKGAVEALLDGTLDEQKLMTNSTEIEQWLEAHPSPYSVGTKHGG